MDEQERRAAFINSYRQHRRGWIGSNTGDTSTNSFNSTTSSLWSCNNVSSMSEYSMEELSENLAEGDSVSFAVESTKLDQSAVTVIVEPPETSRCYLTSSSSLTSSIPFSNEMMTSSHDNGPSSEISTPENNFLKTFPATLKLDTRLTSRKSSDDDDIDASRQRSTRSKRKLSPRRFTPRRNAGDTSRTNIKCFSSPYPSSVTSSTGHCSMSDSSSDDDNTSFSKLNLIDDVFNRNSINKKCNRNLCSRKTDSVFSNEMTITKQKNGVVAGQPLNDDATGKIESSFSNEIKSPKLIPATNAIENKIIINVSGMIHEVETETLNRFPNSMLGNPRKRRQYYDRIRKEYFLDRHRDTFQVVLDYYYNGGVLHRPDDIPIDIFLNELKFYSLDRDTLESFLREEGILHVEIKKEIPNGKFKKFIWRIFEENNGTILAKIVTIISALVIILSVIVFCLETLDGFKSLSINITHHFEVGLNVCHHNVFEPDNATAFAFEPYFRLKHRSSSLNYYELSEDNLIVFSALSEYPISYLAFTLENLLKTCQKNTTSLQYKYAFARCLVQLEDKKDSLSKVFEQINVTKPEIVHSLYFERKSFAKVLPENDRLSQVKFDSFYAEYSRHKKIPEAISYSAHKEASFNMPADIATQENAMSTNQSFFFAQKVCDALDVSSTKTPYEWFVLEGKMGSPAGILFLTETSCIFWFVTEFLLRFFSSPNRKKFVKSFLNVIDFLAILPYFITLIVTTIETKTHVRPQTATILRTIRLVRMLRILKLSRYSRGFRILGLTLVRSTRVLFLLVCFQVVLAVLFSSIAYFVEYDDPRTKFNSIPETIWWALITMTTVGYGDVYPITIWGKIAGACCAIMGILCISFPVPVVVSNFNYLYHLDKDKFKLAPEDLMEEEEEERGENFEKFRESLFEEMRRSVSGLTEEKTNRNPAELWNIARKNYRTLSLAKIDARLEKSPSRSTNLSQASSKKSTMIKLHEPTTDNRSTKV